MQLECKAWIEHLTSEALLLTLTLIVIFQPLSLSLTFIFLQSK